MSKQRKLSSRQEDFCVGIILTMLFGGVVFFYTSIKTWVAKWLPTVFMWGVAAVLIVAAVVFLFNAIFAVSDERDEDVSDEDGTLEEEEGGDDE